MKPALECATYTVRYPSGAEFTAAGQLGVLRTDSGVVYPAIDRGADVLALDPRAVIRCHGERAYGPRDLAPDDHHPAMLDWLTGHPEWDQP